MLKKLHFKNVKAWGDQLWEAGIDLAPISLLLGPNSAGKTSILQVPLLMKQTFESPDRQLDLNLGGQQDDLVDLGSYPALVHDHNEELEVGIGCEVTVETPEGKGLEIAYRATFIQVNESPAIQRLQIQADGAEFAATRQAKGGYLLAAPHYEPPLVQGRPDARRSYKPERSIAFSTEAITELGAQGAKVQDLSLGLRQAFQRIAYLGPLREQPERSYQWSGVEHGNLGKRGERAVHALLASDNSRHRQKEGEEGGRQWLVQRVSKWLRDLGVADDLVLERQGGSRHYELKVVRQGMRANIIDVGFGISQVLPMLVLAYQVPQGTTIIAEQPEIHLHPRAQVGLAELMADVAKTRKVQFLIETHSEHLFRRLQTLVADESLPATDCAAYFVEGSETGGAMLRRLALDEFGKVTNWPKHFFGDAIGETERQMRRMIERMKAREAKK